MDAAAQDTGPARVLGVPWSLLVDALPDAVGLVEPGPLLVFANRRLLALCGEACAPAHAVLLSEALPAPLREAALAACAQAFGAGRDARARSPDEGDAAWELSVSLLPAQPTERPRGLLVARRLEGDRIDPATLEDEARKRAELQTILDSMADGLLIYGPRGEILRVNTAMRRLFGAPDEFFAWPLPQRIAFMQAAVGDGRRLGPEQMPGARALRGETVRDEIAVAHRPDGGVTWLSVTASPIRVGGAIVGAVVSHADISERKQFEEALRRSEAVLAQAGEMAHLGAWWLELTEPGDLDACPLHWSSETFRIFGYEPDSVPARMSLAVARCHPEDREALRRALLLALGQGRPWSLEHRLVRTDGAVRVVLQHGQLVPGEPGRPSRLVGAVQDVTERKQLEEALRDADRRKDEFLGMLSHELRNPLAPIHNSLYLLHRAQGLDARARKAAEVIDRQVSQLARLVDDLLDVTRIARGKIRLQRARLDLADLVRRSVDDHRSLFTANRLRLALEIPPGPLWVEGDAARVAQIVGNLLTNAAKFTPPGGEVAVALSREEPGQAAIAVRDSGTGIDPETLSRLFTPFSQADRSLDRSRGGLGLGLALVKGLAELHGGEATAHSEGPNRGACFTVRLPLAPEAAAAAPELAAAPARSAPSASRRVLVVEDNPDTADGLREVLEVFGHQVEVARTGPEGLTRAKAFRPEVVLCDIGLPLLDGYGVARGLRGDPELARAFLVALTGYARPDDRRQAFAAGFDRHLAKPPDLDALERMVAEAPSAE